MDQDSFMIADILRYLSIKRRIEWETKAHGDTDRAVKENPDIVTEDIFS